MKTDLGPLERRTVNDLLIWDDTRRKVEQFTAFFALALGGGLAAVVAIYTATHLQDQTVYAVSLPGFAGALAFIAVYLFLSMRTREKHHLATIIRKLSDTSANLG